LLTSTFSCLASWLHKRSALRLPLLLLGILFATGRRTVTSWFRAAAITDDFRAGYTTVCVVGRHVPHMAIGTFFAVKPLLSGPRLTVAIDDTPTPRFGEAFPAGGYQAGDGPGKDKVNRAASLGQGLGRAEHQTRIGEGQRWRPARGTWTRLAAALEVGKAMISRDLAGVRRLGREAATI
jgi:hypothetical protein